MLSYEGRKPPDRPPKPKSKSHQGVSVAERLRQAQSFKEQVDQGKCQADIARELGVTRTRVTQIMKLLRLSPMVKQYLLAEEKRSELPTERSLRPLLTMPTTEQEEWAAQNFPDFEMEKDCSRNDDSQTLTN
jgi:hypothetical protein